MLRSQVRSSCGINFAGSNFECCSHGWRYKLHQSKTVNKHSSKQVMARNADRLLTTWASDNVLQKSILRCHQPSLSPGHSADRQGWSGLWTSVVVVKRRCCGWVSAGWMVKLIVTLRFGSSERTVAQARASEALQASGSLLFPERMRITAHL